MDAEKWLTAYFDKYTITPNVTYKTVDGKDLKLDLYTPRIPQGPNPTVVYYHGGGWIEGSKEEATLWGLLPYMVRGWSLVNVQYRKGPEYLAPAAVEDCQDALEWVLGHTGQYLFDPERIITTGFSAGGHLALITGMLAAFLDKETGTSLDKPVPTIPIRKSPVAAIVNWCGITDVAGMLEGLNLRQYACQWVGAQPNKYEIATRVSPMSYVKPGIPPIITLHGDADLDVPYCQGVALDEALARQGLIHQLITTPGGGHCNFSPEENMRSFEAIFGFLEKHCSMC